MIGKTSRGPGFRGVLIYVFGPGKHNKPGRAEYIGGTLSGEFVPGTFASRALRIGSPSVQVSQHLTHAAGLAWAARLRIRWVNDAKTAMALLSIGTRGEWPKFLGSIYAVNELASADASTRARIDAAPKTKLPSRSLRERSLAFDPMSQITRGTSPRSSCARRCR